MTPRRSLLTKKSALILGAVLLLCAVLLLVSLRLPKGVTAVAERGGEELFRWELASLTEPVEQEILGEDGIVLLIRISPDGAEVVSSQCPDKTCVRTGKLTHAGETAVCLPARVTLRLEGASAPDGVTY